MAYTLAAPEVQFSGPPNDYSVSAVGTGDLLITDNRAGQPDGTELVSNISDFVFQDGTYTPGTILDPIVTQVAVTPSTGDEGIGKTIQISLTFSEQVTVTGAVPSLTLNDGGAAVYASGSGTNMLTFNYTVASTEASQNPLGITAVQSASSLTDAAGNIANFAGAIQNFTGLQIDTGPLVVTNIAANPGTGDINAGKTITITLTFDKFVEVIGTPTLTLNDGGVATYTSGDGNTLVFSTTVANGQNVPALAITGK